MKRKVNNMRYKGEMKGERGRNEVIVAGVSNVDLTQCRAAT